VTQTARDRENDLRRRLREIMSQDPRAGMNREIARRANLSPSTVSKFARAIYTGDNSAVAERLGQVLADLDAATAIASGDWKAAWIVKRGRNVRLIRKRDTVEAMREQDPDAHVVQIWIGPGPKDLCFTEEKA
jgi:hypothetical protein